MHYLWMFFSRHYDDRTPRQGVTRRDLKWILAVFFLVAATGQSAKAMSLLSPPSETYKKQLATLDEQLLHLPDPAPSAGPWTMGFRTQPLESANDQQTINVIFEHPAPVDLIILMPAAQINDGCGLKEFGFPEHFFIERILADGTTDLLADYRETFYPFHGLEPQLFPCPDRKPVTGIRLTVTTAPLVKAPGKKYYAIALSEIFAFAGPVDVALNAKVNTSNSRWTATVWNEPYLVDGFFLFSPSDEKQQSGEKDFNTYSDRATILFDLGRDQAVDELRIWPSTGSGDRHPIAGGAGFPNEIKFQVLDMPDTPKPHTLYRHQFKISSPGTTPFSHRIKPTEGRFFQFVLKNSIPNFRTGIPDMITLGEIELLYKGRVITRGIIPTAQIDNIRKDKTDNPKKLTNGWVGDGKIRPLRIWLEEFHRQRKLLREQAQIQNALDNALEHETEQARMMGMLGSVLIALLALMIWVVRLLSERRWSRMKEQIACDLHDELGANLSSIAHSAEMAKELTEQGNQQLVNNLLNQTIDAARLTGDETRHFIQFLEGRDTGVQLPGQIRDIALQILGSIDHRCTFHVARPFSLLNPARKWDLLFFVKEALNNILKHAGADHVEIITQKKGRKVQLIITDNGCGIPKEKIPPRHLASRAKKLKGILLIESEKDQGTRIQLTLHKKHA